MSRAGCVDAILTTMVLLIVGVVLVIAGAVVLPLLARRSAGRARTFAQVPHYDCAQVAEHGDQAPGMRVAVHGRAVAGPGGALTAPASERPCAWYRLTISERHRRVERDSKGRTTTREEERVVSDERSSDPITLADATGTVTVEPKGADIDRSLETHNRVQPPPSGAGSRISFAGMSVDIGSRDGLIGIRTREQILPLEADLYVLGGAGARDGTGVIGQPREGLFVISTRSAEELARGARTGMRWFAGSAGAVTIAGAVLIVVGLLR
jgi:hypothetical protein